MDNDQFELYYSDGGHGGPYPNFDNAVENAIHLILGRTVSHSIEIRNRKTNTKVGVVTRRHIEEYDSAISAAKLQLDRQISRS